MSIRVKIKRNDLMRVKKAAPKKADAALNALTAEGLAYVVNSFGVSPSPVGSPPGVDTGTLKNAMHWRKRKNLLYAIVSGVDYAAPLEFGTSRMGARPFMGPMAKWLELQVPRVFDEFLS